MPCAQSWLPLPDTTEAVPPTAHAAIVSARAARRVFGGRRLLGASEGGAAQEETLRDALAAEMRRALLERGSTDPYLPDAAFTLLRRLDAGVALGERVLGPAPPPRQRGQPVPLARPAEQFRFREAPARVHGPLSE